MKKLFVLSVLAVLFGCNNTSVDDREVTPLLHPRGVLELFNDGSGIASATVYASDSTVLEQGNYHNNLRQGAYTVFHSNGFVKSVTAYVAGKKEGQMISLDDRGQILERYTYHNDELNGQYVKYNRSQLKEKGEYVNGKLSGILEKYYANGSIMERSNYTNGQYNGAARWYNQKGNNTIAYDYNMGELVGDIPLEVVVDEPAN